MSDSIDWSEAQIEWEDWLQSDALQPDDTCRPLEGMAPITKDYTPQEPPHSKTAKSLTYYHDTKCATCDAPLELFEQNSNLAPVIRCSLDQSDSHFPVRCIKPGCGQPFATLAGLETHYTNHDTHGTQAKSCGRLISDERIQYLRSYQSFSCAQCWGKFSRQTGLDKHGTKALHMAYTCGFPECASQAARISDLLRHQKVHQSTVTRFSCTHCRKYRGNNGFKRKDHLRQHILGYHHIMRNDADAEERRYECTRAGCDKIGSDAVETKKLLQTHLKKDHDSPFQCPEPGCDRVGKKGWMRERDMVKHITKIHSAIDDGAIVAAGVVGDIDMGLEEHDFGTGLVGFDFSL